MASVIRGSDNFDTTFMTVGSLATNGYTKLPNGVIIQWGYTTLGSGTITFPIAFTTACLNASFTIHKTTNEGSRAHSKNVSSFTTSGLTFTYTDYGSTTLQGAYWIAIGY